MQCPQHTTLKANTVLYSLLDQSFTAYVPTDRNATVILSFSGMIIDATIRKVREIALSKMGTSSPAIVFRVNVNPSIEETVKEITSAFETARADKKQELLKVTGLSVENNLKCLKTAKAISLNFFNKKNDHNPIFDEKLSPYNIKEGRVCGHPFFSYNLQGEKIEEWALIMSVKMLNYSYHALGLTQSPEHVFFSEEDLNTFKIDKSEVEVDPTQISCLAHALLKAKVQAACSLIFKDAGGDENFTASKLLKNLEEWGFIPAEVPQAGDLVVYITDDDRPKHVGYFTERGTILSKLGRSNPYSHEHKLFHIPPCYGSKALFFRKVADS